ncbi:MAG: hypothetical protein LBV28_05730 [Puniceicoccales bacterium]|jgi:hypothetical protein|nr:hypothetical protein [Puniceicoccales bacterium]
MAEIAKRHEVNKNSLKDGVEKFSFASERLIVFAIPYIRVIRGQKNVVLLYAHFLF